MQRIMPLAPAGGALAGVGELAKAAEDANFEGISMSEINNDPMLEMTIAAGSTDRVQLMANVVIAFARSPMTLAMQATALQNYSCGRVILGIGSQIKPHIERRFSMPWSSPAARMREYIMALQSIWHSWETGEKLDFRGDFYTHTLSMPEYVPTVSRPRPKVLLAAVGEGMTRVAGAVADGVIIHPFTTSRYLHEVTLPALRRGAEESGRSIDEFDIAGSPFVISGRTDDEIAAARERVRSRIAFYGSTPAYRPVLAVHGWEELGVSLNAMSKSDDSHRWDRMADLVPDDVLNAFAVQGQPALAGEEIVRRFGSVFEYLCINPNGVSGIDTLGEVMDAIKASGDRLGGSAW